MKAHPTFTSTSNALAFRLGAIRIVSSHTAIVRTHNRIASAHNRIAWKDNGSVLDCNRIAWKDNGSVLGCNRIVEGAIVAKTAFTQAL